MENRAPHQPRRPRVPASGSICRPAEPHPATATRASSTKAKKPARDRQAAMPRTRVIDPPNLRVSCRSNRRSPLAKLERVQTELSSEVDECTVNRPDRTRYAPEKLKQTFRSSAPARQLRSDNAATIVTHGVGNSHHVAPMKPIRGRPATFGTHTRYPSLRT